MLVACRCDDFVMAVVKHSAHVRICQDPGLELWRQLEEFSTFRQHDRRQRAAIELDLAEADAIFPKRLQVLHPASDSSYFAASLIDREPLNLLTSRVDMTRHDRGQRCGVWSSPSPSTSRKLAYQVVPPLSLSSPTQTNRARTESAPSANIVLACLYPHCLTSGNSNRCYRSVIRRLDGLILSLSIPSPLFERSLCLSEISVRTLTENKLTTAQPLQ